MPATASVINRLVSTSVNLSLAPFTLSLDLINAYTTFCPPLSLPCPASIPNLLISTGICLSSFDTTALMLISPNPINPAATFPIPGCWCTVSRELKARERLLIGAGCHRHRDTCSAALRDLAGACDALHLLVCSSPGGVRCAEKALIFGRQKVSRRW